MIFHSDIIHNRHRRKIEAELLVYESTVKNTPVELQENSSPPVRVTLHVEGVTLPPFLISYNHGCRLRKREPSFVYNGFSVEHGLFARSGGVSIAPLLARKVAKLVESWYWEFLRTISQPSALEVEDVSWLLREYGSSRPGVQDDTSRVTA